MQHTQRIALDTYTTFLDGLKEHNMSQSSTQTGSSDLKLNVFYNSFDSKKKIKSNLSSDQSKQFNNTNTSSMSNTIYWKQMSQVADKVTWNIRLLTGQIELLAIMQNETNNWIKQVKESSLATGLLITNLDEKHKINLSTSANQDSSYKDGELNQIMQHGYKNLDWDSNKSTHNDQDKSNDLKTPLTKPLTTMNSSMLKKSKSRDNLFYNSNQNVCKRLLGPLLENFLDKNKTYQLKKESQFTSKFSTSSSSFSNEISEPTKSLLSDGPITLNTYINYKKNFNNLNNKKNG